MTTLIRWVFRLAVSLVTLVILLVVVAVLSWGALRLSNPMKGDTR